MGIVRYHASDVPHVTLLAKNYPVHVTFELTTTIAPINKVLHFGTSITSQPNKSVDPISKAIITPLRLKTEAHVVPMS